MLRLLAEVEHTVPGTWMWGREGRGRVPPCLHTGVSPRKDAVCEICLPTCPGISSGINQSDSTQVLAVMAAEGRGSWAPDVVAGGGRDRLPTPLETRGSLVHRRGMRDVWGMEPSPDLSQITKATIDQVPTCGTYSAYTSLFKTGTGMKVFVTAKKRCHAVPMSTLQRQGTYVRPYCVLPVAQAGERARGGLTTEQCVWKGPPGGNPKVDSRHRIPRERSKGSRMGPLPLSLGTRTWSSRDLKF